MYQDCDCTFSPLAQAEIEEKHVFPQFQLEPRGSSCEYVDSFNLGLTT